MKERNFYAQGLLLEVAKEIIEQKKLITIDLLDDEVEIEIKEASRKALTFALNKIYEKMDELDKK